MLTKLIPLIKKIDLRVVLFFLTVVVFIIGAGAPGAVGI